MGRSVFILKSKRKAVMKAQFRKLRDEFSGTGLATEGPFGDKGNAVGNLVDDIKKRVKFGTSESAAKAAMLTLGPQNLPTIEESWLKVPFYFGRGLHHEIDSAGAVAVCDTVDSQKGKARVVSPEDLTLLAVSVLRRMGVRSHYAYMHIDGDSTVGMLSNMLQSLGMASALPTPCIVINEEKPQLVTPFFPFVMEYPSRIPVGSLEVLDDNAVQALVYIKLADSMKRLLMHDIASESPYATPEMRSIKAIHIGHSLFEGTNLWTDTDVDESVKLSNALFGKDMELESARDKMAMTLMHDIICRHCHTMEAINRFLCDGAREEISDLLEQAAAGDMHGAVDAVNQAISSVSDHECYQTFNSYMALALKMITHIHASSGCDETKKNSN